MKIVAYRLLLLVGLLSVPAASAQDKLTIKEERPYFPLKEGSVWTYILQGKPYVTKLTGFEKSGEDVCARLETRRGQDLISTELVTVRKDGVYRVEFSGKKFTKPVRFFKLPVKNNESWKIEDDTKVGEQDVKGNFKFGEAKGVKVKAGLFDTVTVTADLKVENQNTTVTYYFAEKTGMVKQTIVIGTTTVELELDKYEEGKK